MVNPDKLRQAQLAFNAAHKKIISSLTMKENGADWEAKYSDAYQALHRADPSQFPQICAKYRRP